MLHVTNGDSAAQRIRDTGLPGTILPWRDVLHDGPVPAGLDVEGLRTVRARFIADTFELPHDKVLREFAQRDNTLAWAADDEEIVLWFEHDLYDQLQLVQILNWAASRPAGPSAMSLVCGDEYLGRSTPDRLRERFPARQPLSAAQCALGRRAWAAFRSPDPAAISEVIAGDTSSLRFLRDALTRHLQQFPSTVNGLSRSESRALAVLQKGAATLAEVFAASHQAPDEPIFLGDSMFARYMESLSRGPEPLVVGEDGSPVVAPRHPADDESFWSGKVRLTTTGGDVLAGGQDHVRLNGVDRWLGGVHLAGTEVRFRWDAEQGRVRDTHS